MTDGVRVNLVARNDVIGDVLRQKQTLERVSEVLCDFHEDPVKTWLDFARLTRTTHPSLAARCTAIADLIEAESL
jgi:transposase